MNDKLTHIAQDGSAQMVDVGDKDVTKRMAKAYGIITMQPETLTAIRSGNMKKGDVIGTARLAGIMAAKRTHELIPLCHGLALSSVEIDIQADDTLPGLIVVTQVKVNGQTGVEMEALTAVSVACLTLYDMAKAIDKSMQIGEIKLLHKTGGRSGNWSNG